MNGYKMLGLQFRIGKYRLRIWRKGFEYGNELGGRVVFFPWVKCFAHPMTVVGLRLNGSIRQKPRDTTRASLKDSKIVELEKLHSMEAEAHHKTASLYRQARLENEQLAEKLRVATETLQSVFDNKNANKGDWHRCREALEKIRGEKCV